MSLRLVLMPWWLRWLAYSAVAFPFIAGLVLLGDYPGVSAAVPWASLSSWGWIGALTLATGLLLAIASPRQRASIRACLEGVSPQDYRSVRRAAAAGAVPSDPAIRQAAAQLTSVQSRGLKGVGRVMPWLCGFLLVNQVVQVCVVTRPIVLREVFLIVIWSGLTIYWWLYPRIIESRRELLSTHQAADATA
ncbi:hypothetical protein XA26_37350 [Mycolicibacterium fortuitum]|uniref:Transmembrane protein n=1 Tax=Mycolicibacterium fortuitum TaxID=1766 RepID=A0A0N9XHS9_MYCFO|nr:hypothetical protein [Mycolicibacterium fortuitum]ALI27556.1 hypothetical protein XA26_37350 [Mycolicibacterium fortuitum]